MTEPLCVLTVDLAAIAANYRRLAARSSPARCGATVKADAYGLGMEKIAPVLAAQGCDAFFVANLDEGAALRAILAGVDIFILNGLAAGESDDFLAHDLIPVLNAPDEIAAWASAAARLARALPAAIHIDTGINRLGLAPAQVRKLAAEGEKALAGLNLKLVMSHLACGAQGEHEMNATQGRLFDELRALLPKAPASLANTAGVFLGAPYHLHMTRPGIGLYGGSPFAQPVEDIANVIDLRARILQVRAVHAGDRVGYDATWTARGPTRIAIAALGYGDGYGAGFDNRGIALVADTQVPVIGKISMDLLALDVSAIDGDKVSPGMTATLVGEGLGLDEVAARGGMSNYQLLTALGQRVARRHKPYEAGVG
ncbi:MAG: alanine racemase [Pseudomonadota bacterium]